MDGLEDRLINKTTQVSSYRTPRDSFALISCTLLSNRCVHTHTHTHACRCTNLSQNPAACFGNTSLEEASRHTASHGCMQHTVTILQKIHSGRHPWVCSQTHTHTHPRTQQLEQDTQTRPYLDEWGPFFTLSLSQLSLGAFRTGRQSITGPETHTLSYGQFRNRNYLGIRAFRLWMEARVPVEKQQGTEWSCSRTERAPVGIRTATRLLCCAQQLFKDAQTQKERNMKKSNGGGWRDVQECFAQRLQQCGAVFHGDGWGRKWQHKWLLKRGNGGIYKNYVRLCLRPMSHIILGYCVLRPDLCDFPALNTGQALLKPYVILLSKKLRRWHL